MNQSAIVMQYVDAWSRTTEPEILSALAGCWTPQTTYTDPITDATRGPAELAQVILRFHAAFPGGTLVATSLLDTHHTFGRFSWQLRLPAPVEINGVSYGTETDGFDFVEFTPDGTRISRVVGFFGPFPR
jgi:hypothetical protein